MTRAQIPCCLSENEQNATAFTATNFQGSKEKKENAEQTIFVVNCKCQLRFANLFIPEKHIKIMKSYHSNKVGWCKSEKSMHSQGNEANKAKKIQRATKMNDSKIIYLFFFGEEFVKK